MRQSSGTRMFVCACVCVCVWGVGGGAGEGKTGKRKREGYAIQGVFIKYGS